MTGLVLDEPGEKELGGTQHGRKCPAPQKLLIAGEGVTLPQVSAQPSGGHPPHGCLGVAIHGICVAPHGNVVVSDPPRQPVGAGSCLPPVDDTVVDEIEQWLVAF